MYFKVEVFFRKKFFQKLQYIQSDRNHSKNIHNENYIHFLSMIDIEQIKGLTLKSRGILYRLKSVLEKKKVSLDDHICIIFEYRKEKFKKKQFHELIRKNDQDLVLSQVDDLFDELDQNQNGFVFYQNLLQAFININEEDNPGQSLNKKSRIMNDQSERMKIAIDLKDKLLETQNYLEWVNVFDHEQMGYLNRGSLKQLMKSLDILNSKKQQEMLSYLLGNKQSLTIGQLLGKLDLDKDAKRIKLENFEVSEEVVLEESLRMSQFIKKEKSKSQSKIKPTQFMEENMLDSTTTAFENIPQALTFYFNYSSQLEQPLTSIAWECIQNKIIFFDSQNPSSSKGHAWVHIAEYTHNNFFLFKEAQSLIRRENNRKGLGGLMEPKDIIQGGFGDCYFLSAVAAIVDMYPELVYNLFVFEKNPAHIYGVRLFIDGMWKTIILDGCFPADRFGNLVGAQPHHRKIWVMLLEKAWAKSFKSYDNIHAGYNEEGLVAISGAPTISVSSRKNGFLIIVEAYLNKGAIVTCATSRDVHQLTEQEQEKLGVFAGHAYTFLKAYADLPYQGHMITLIKMRNPWGRKGWKGDWSFSSKKWTHDLRDVVNYNVDPQDGTFFISLDDFIVYFDNLNICQVNLAHVNSWVRVNASRYEFYEINFQVKQKGDYFFTIYQQNPRNYKNKGAYQKSKSWLFLMKVEESNKIQAVASSATDLQDNTIETSLQAGTYKIVSKVCWKFHEEHEFRLTAYGPAKIKFSEPKISDSLAICSHIESKSNLGFGDVRLLNQGLGSMRTYFNNQEGYGFMCITNQNNNPFDFRVNFNPFKGLTILYPYSLPLTLTIFPYETIVCKFIVDPRGYSYRLHFY